jgi:hypothetical protein
VDQSTVFLPMLMMGAQRIVAALVLAGLGLVLGGAMKAPLVTLALVALAAWLVLSWARTWTGVIAARGAL